MFFKKIQNTCFAVSLAAIAATAPASAEDGVALVAIDCGAACATFQPDTHFLTALPGASFVINVAYLAPAPEEALDSNNMPIMCDPIRFRVDTLSVGAVDGLVSVGLGDKLELQPGEVSQIVQKIDVNKGRLPTGMDMQGYRLRADSPSSRCSLVANGLYYSSDTAAPMPFALLPGSNIQRR